jgi:hypothetical protein
VSFPGVKWLGRALTTHPYLAPRSKKQQSYSWNSPLDLHGQFWGKLYLFYLFTREEQAEGKDRVIFVFCKQLMIKRENC